MLTKSLYHYFIYLFIYVFLDSGRYIAYLKSTGCEMEMHPKYKKNRHSD